MENENQTFDLSGLDTYYQKEFSRIYESNETYKGKWNWWAFFFTSIWAFIKGCWLIGILSLFTISFTLYRQEIAPGVYFIIGGPTLIWSLIYGWRGTWFYYNAKIKKKQFPSL